MKSRFKISRRSFINNYFISLSILLLMLLVDSIFGIPNLIFFPLMILSVFFLVEPEVSLVYYRYDIDSEKLTQTSGIITKKIEVIPWRLASKVELKQGVFGRIFNYGNIFVSDVSEAPGITLRGVSKPGKILQLIEEKITNAKM
jgi:membrane protein YdbS with pleckstrin-like domain